MFRKLLIFGMCCLSLPTLAKEIGKVQLIKGKAMVKNVELKKGDSIQEGDKLQTAEKSIIKIKMMDDTLISLGPNSLMDFASYHEREGKRNNIIKFLKGKARVLVNKKAKKGEKIQFNSQSIAMGVRGTEFLTNAYLHSSAPSSDLLLIKGNINVAGKGIKPFDLKPGQFFNSSDLISKGMGAIQTLTPAALEAIQKSNFLPNLMQAGGLINLQGQLLSGAGAAVGMIGGVVGAVAGGETDSQEKKSEDKSKLNKKEVKKESKAKKTSMKGVLEYKYDLSKEKWDIRNAVMNRKKNKKKNKCFYFKYKKAGGYGRPERFRRDRDCDEFEFDL